MLTPTFISQSDLQAHLARFKIAKLIADYPKSPIFDSFSFISKPKILSINFKTIKPSWTFLQPIDLQHVTIPRF
jgi:hypothetical protein